MGYIPNIRIIHKLTLSALVAFSSAFASADPLDDALSAYIVCVQGQLELDAETTVETFRAACQAEYDVIGTILPPAIAPMIIEQAENDAKQ